jgi:hypothetical protein
MAFEFERPMRLWPPDQRQVSDDDSVGRTLDTVLHSLLDASATALDEHALQLVNEIAASLQRVRELLDTKIARDGHIHPAVGG